MVSKEGTELSFAVQASKDEQSLPPNWHGCQSMGESGGSMNRYHSIHVPKCRDCKRRWPFPREVSFVAGIPEDVYKTKSLSSFEPTTKECIVAYQTWDRKTNETHLREEIFSRLKLTHTLKTTTCLKRALGVGRLQYHRLVQEFDYNRKTGDVTHSSEFFSEDQEDHFRYARLLTLNAWYQTLLFNILQMVVDVFNLAAGAMMIAQLFSEYGGFQRIDYVKQTRVWYAGWFCFMIFVAFAFAARSAYWEWKVTSSPAVGDIVSRCHPIDRALTFVAMVIFIFFGVDKIIKDAPKILHPWKSVMPYAAVKIEGTRVHVLGYKSRPLFAVENASGQFHVLLMHALSKLVSFIYKGSIVGAIYLQNMNMEAASKQQAANSSSAPTPSPAPANPGGDSSKNDKIRIQSTLILSTVVSGFATLLVFHKVIKLRQQRLLLKTELLRVLETAVKKADKAKFGPAKKLLALHFNLEYADGGTRKAKAADFTKGDDTRCGRCGRAYEFHDMPSFTPEGSLELANSAQLLSTSQKTKQRVW